MAAALSRLVAGFTAVCVAFELRGAHAARVTSIDTSGASAGSTKLAGRSDVGFSAYSDEGQAAFASVLDNANATWRIPEWLMSIKDIVAGALQDPSFTNFRVMDSMLFNATLDRLETLEVKLKNFKLGGEAGEMWVDFDEVHVHVRAHFSSMKVAGAVPVNLNSLLGGAYVDAKVAGGLRAGFELNGEDWKAKCLAEGVPKENIPKMDMSVKFHINKLFDWVGTVGPYVVPYIRGAICSSVAEALHGFKEAHAAELTAIARAKRVFAFIGDAMHGFRKQGDDCWQYGCRGGPCPFCGEGYCCRKGEFGGGCDGMSGVSTRHTCVPAPEPPAGPTNLGAECWNKAKCRDGRCGFCGSGLCCRLGRSASECNGEVGGERGHICVEGVEEEDDDYTYLSSDAY